MTKTLHDPADAARFDLELEYLAAYKGIGQSVKEETFTFEFAIIQRLMHAEVLGRWGIPRLEVDGMAAVVPYFVVVEGEINVDILNGRLELVKKSAKGYNWKAQQGREGLR